MKGKDDILVSIIVPVFNVEEYLDNCISSIVCQTYKNIEILLIDDGSTDNSANICDQWKEKDKRIKVWHKENSGISAVRNMGIKFCNGEYLLFVDSDDIVHEKYVEVLLNSLFENNCEMAMINWIDKFSDGSERKHEFSTLNKLLNREEFLDHIEDKNSYKGMVWNKIFSKKIIEENNIYFDEKIFYAEDFLFVVRYASKIEKIYYEFDEHLYYYFSRNGSATRTEFNYKKATFLNIFDELIEIFQSNNVDTGRLKKHHLYFYFLAMFYLDNKKFPRNDYKRMRKKYMIDIINSKKISCFGKIKVFLMAYLPDITFLVEKRGRKCES